MNQPQRAILRIICSAATSDAEMIRYLQSNPVVNHRELVLRSLRAFYLPNAIAGKVETEELQRCVESAISELYYGAFQLQSHFDIKPPQHGLIYLPSQNGASPGYDAISPASQSGDALPRHQTEESRELIEFGSQEFSQVLDDF